MLPVTISQLRYQNSDYLQALSSHAGLNCRGQLHSDFRCLHSVSLCLVHDCSCDILSLLVATQLSQRLPVVEGVWEIPCCTNKQSCCVILHHLASRRSHAPKYYCSGKARVFTVLYDVHVSQGQGGIVTSTTMSQILTYGAVTLAAFAEQLPYKHPSA